MIFHTYGGGPSGGFILYEDGPLFSWHQNWFTEKVRTRLRGESLRIRRHPDAPQYFQVKATADDVGESAFGYANDNYVSEVNTLFFFKFCVALVFEIIPT